MKEVPEMAAAESIKLQVYLPVSLKIKGNAENGWKGFKQQFQLYMKTTGADKLEEELKMTALNRKRQ